MSLQKKTIVEFSRKTRRSPIRGAQIPLLVELDQQSPLMPGSWPVRTAVSDKPRTTMSFLNLFPLILAIAGTSLAVQAANPFLPGHEYIPDGEPRAFGDRVYPQGRRI
jgi:hypothetical protein